jgi:hypothetical protein
MANRPDQPGDFPPQFAKYWLAGEGAALIRWGTDGDFDRCRVAINEKVTKHGGKPLPDHEISGLCAKLHKRATGATPGHAPGESKPGTRH